MANDDVTLVSTTNSLEEVRAALQMRDPKLAAAPVESTPAVPVATPVAAPVTPPAPKDTDDDASPKAQQRIARVVREKNEAMARIDQLEREVAAQRVAPPPGAPVVAPPPAGAPTFDTAKPVQADFDDFDKFQDALGDWMNARAEFNASAKAEAKVHEILQEQHKRAWVADQQRQAQVQMAGYFERVESARAQVADYDEAMQAEHLSVHPDQIPAIRDFTFHEPNGTLIGYYLAKSPAEFDRIARLPYGAQLAELGRLDAKLAAGQLQVPAAGVVAQRAPAAAPVVPIQAPVARPSVSAAPLPPPRMPAGGGGGAQPVTLDQLAKTNDYQAFKRSRATH